MYTGSTVHYVCVYQSDGGRGSWWKCVGEQVFHLVSGLRWAIQTYSWHMYMHSLCTCTMYCGVLLYVVCVLCGLVRWV